MKILIIRVSAIGDVVHTLPSVFLLKQLLPGCSISWVVQKKAADLLIDQPLFDHIWVLPDHYLAPSHCAATIATMHEIRRHRWDAIIDFQGLLKTSLIMLILHGKKFGFSRVHARSGFTTLCTHDQHTPEYTNIVQKNLSLASHVAYALHPYDKCPSVEVLAKDFVFEVSQGKQHVVEAWCKKNVHQEFFHKKIVLLTPNTTRAEKHWPVEHWVELVQLWARHKEASGQVTFMLVGKDHGAAARDVYKGCLERGIELVSLPGWDLATLAYFVKQAALVVAPDTGVLHLADFLGTQTIALFGPTKKEMHGPFWQTRNIHNAYQISACSCNTGGCKKQKTVFCPGGMCTLKSRELFERICKCLGIPGGNIV